MSYPIKVFSICGEEFELKPDKPGFANRCPDCSAHDEEERPGRHAAGGVRPASEKERNEARRQAMRDLLYRKDS